MQDNLHIDGNTSRSGIRPSRQHRLNAGARWHHPNATASLGEQAKDVALDAEIVGDDLVFFLFDLAVPVGGLRSDKMRAPLRGLP